MCCMVLLTFVIVYTHLFVCVYCPVLQACAVMALERVPADIRKDGGIARMSDPKVRPLHSASRCHRCYWMGWDGLVVSTECLDCKH